MLVVVEPSVDPSSPDASTAVFDFDELPHAAARQDATATRMLRTRMRRDYSSLPAAELMIH
jgi:hypothetical protein